MTIDLSTITKWVAGIVQPVHKYAALTVAILAGLGVTPGSSTDQHIITVTAAAYAGWVHMWDSIAAKAP